MSLIQRWYFIDDNNEDGVARTEHADYHEGVDTPIHIDHQWCKAKDVAELERLVMAYIGTINELRQDKKNLANTIERLGTDYDAEDGRSGMSWQETTE